MNLIKSFNLKYLKENIKKSKGLIILLLIVVPLLTTLFTVLFVNGDEGVNLATEREINWINLLGMYVVPIGISFALFGYVYRKSSVDLINSMPLNKQTIFVTNTIGGIIVITLMQIITISLLFICGLVCSNLVIFNKMLIDIFLIMWIGYIFIFVVTNLAMTVSGTFLTQLVLTALILFLVPFITMNLKGYMFSTTYKLYVDYIENEWVYVSIIDNYTIPIHELLTFIGVGHTYSVVSLLKTIVLGIIYLVLGAILFKRRKMEDTEESFKKAKVHLLVKALTIFPMIVFLNMNNPSKIVTIFLIAIISIYYFAYDFIIKRKVKLIISIISLVVTLGVSYGAALGMEKFEEKIYGPSRKISFKDIREVSINLESRNLSQNNYEVDNYFIKNEEIVNLIIKSLGNTSDTSQYYEFSDYEYRPQEDFTKYNFTVCYKTKTGKILKGQITMYSEEFHKLIELLSKDENYVNIIKKEFTNNSKIGIDGKVISQELEEAINTELKNVVNNMSLLEIYEKLIIDTNKYYSNVDRASYRNHQYIDKNFNIEVSEEISKIIMRYQNDLFCKYLDKAISWADNIRVVGELYGEEIRQLEENYYNGNFRYFSNTQDDIIEFINENKTVECDPSKDFYQINFYDYKIGFNNIFYTNKIDEINEILKKEYIANYQETNYYQDVNAYPESSEIIY